MSGDDDNEYVLASCCQNNDNHYEVAVSGDGHAGLFAREEEVWHSIVRPRPHEVIGQGSATRHLRLEAKDGAFLSLSVEDW